MFLYFLGLSELMEEKFTLSSLHVFGITFFFCFVFLSECLHIVNISAIFLLYSLVSHILQKGYFGLCCSHTVSFAVIYRLLSQAYCWFGYWCCVSCKCLHNTDFLLFYHFYTISSPINKSVVIFSVSCKLTQKCTTHLRFTQWVCAALQHEHSRQS